MKQTKMNRFLKDGRGGGICGVCDKTIDLSKSVSLELSASSGHFFKEGEMPADEESQGFWDVGSDCARRELAKTKKYLANLPKP